LFGDARDELIHDASAHQLSMLELRGSYRDH
jgi:hypothetical protein